MTYVADLIYQYFITFQENLCTFSMIYLCIVTSFFTDTVKVELSKAQIYMISFQTCTQISGIHKVLIYVRIY